MRINKTTKQQQTVVIYARARGESLDEENQAIQAQLRACREWAEKNGYSVAKAYIDQGKGAYRNLEEREGLKELVADALSKQRPFDVIIYYSPSQLFRDLFEFETFRVRLERQHVQLICVTDGWLRQYKRVSQGRYQSPYPNLSLSGNTLKSRRVRDYQRNRSR